MVVDQEGFRRLPSAIAAYRAAQALLSGDIPGALTHAGSALRLAGPDDHIGRGAASGLLGLAHWRRESPCA